MSEPSKAHILCVDDEPRVVEGLVLHLRRDYNVHIALSGEEALARLADFAFDIIVTDLRLPGVDGRAVLEAAFERYPDIKSGQNFLTLQSQIEGTENRIAIARRDYIEAVRAYNTEITTFPGRIWRAVMYPSAKEMATFDIAAEEMKAPKVDFGTNQ